MGETTAIPWCDATFNPWSGCSRVSPACDHCYAASLPAARRRGAEWGDHPRVLASESYWRQPLAWDRKAEREGKRTRVFCGSTCDVFEDRGELIEPRRRLFELIRATPTLDWLLLTKRPEMMRQYSHCWPANAWAGVTAENQATADSRIPLLLQVPARVRFVSVEPLLGAVDLRGFCVRVDGPGLLSHGHWRDFIHWVICGGESGARARPMHPEWARGLRDQCQAAGARFFFKQWGEWLPDNQRNFTIGTNTPFPSPSGGLVYVGGGFRLVRDADGKRIWDQDPGWRDGEHWVTRVGTRAAGHLLDGREWREVPCA